MSPGISPRASEIFLALSSRPPAERATVLDRECAGDAALRREVEDLLAGLDEAPGPLDTPVLRPGHVERLMTSAGPDDEAPDSGPLPTMGTQVGDFTLLDVLGTGGAGVVYRALQRHPVRTVALKLLREGLAGSAVRKRFEVEAEILARLHHPGIAQVYAAHPGDERTPPFIAMELVEGQPITEHAADRNLDVPQRLELVARVCDAVQHAHQRGVIHRDLKPANILVTADGRPKVVDFGVARAADPSLAHTTIRTEAGQLLGTVPFMSPEQVQAGPEGIDTRTDVYALGVVLFRLLTGHVPFGKDDPSLVELARRIVEEPPPRLATMVPSLSGDLDTILSRTLAKDRDRRYASAADLASDLRRYIAGQPIAAAADSAWYVLRTRVARYRRAFVLALAGGAAVAAVAGYALVQRSRADRANQELQRELARSNVERGRLQAAAGDVLGAEGIVWPELFRNPDSRQALWALAEMYARQPVRWVRLAHEGGANSVRLSAGPRLVLTAGNDGAVKLLDALTGSDVGIVTRYDGRAMGAVFDVDESHVLSFSARGEARYTESRTGRTLHETENDGRVVLAVVPLSEPHTFLVTDDRGNVERWRLGESFDRITLRSFPVISRVLAVSAAGTLIAAGLDDGSVIVWDASNGRTVWHRHVDAGIVTGLAFSPDGRRLVAGGMEQVVRAFDARTGELTRVLHPRNGTVRRLSFDNAGRLLVVGWWRATVWNLAEPGDDLPDEGVPEGAWDGRISGDGHWLVTCEEQVGRVRMWQPGATAVESRWQAHAGRVSGLAIAGGRLYSAGWDGRIRQWSGPPDAVPDRQVGDRVNALVVDPSGTWLAAGGTGGAVAWRPGQAGTVTIPVGSTSALTFGDVEGLLVGEESGMLSAWAIRPTGAERRWSVKLPGEVTGLAANGPHVAVAHRPRRVVLLDAASGQQVRVLTEEATVFPLLLDQGGRRLLAGSWSGTVMGLDLATGRDGLSLTGHARLVGGLAVDATGQTLATASREGTTRLWDLATGVPLATITRRDVGAERVRFLPGEAGRLVIGYDDGLVEIVPTERLLDPVAATAEYARRAHAADRSTFPRADEVIAWSRNRLQASGR